MKNIICYSLCLHKRLLLFVFLMTSFCTQAQFSILGKITDAESKQGLAGANIFLENTFKATFSNSEGEFELDKIKAGAYTLKVSFIGYETFTQQINLSENINLDISLQAKTFLADEIVVSATRATEKSAIAYVTLSEEDLEKQNLGQDLPILLNFTPSTVVSSDAGAGVGYTGVRIRGSDPTRTNVTINGIPLNDAESQGVFWVNMPDFASSVESIQIQRGVGTSTNGAGAFGATINIQTNQLREEAYIELDNSYGSFNTWKHTVKVGSGLINNKFTLDGRLSRISSDGFIDRGSSDLRSFYLSGAYYGKKSSIRINIFSGSEVTYQSWYGIPEAKLRGDEVSVKAFIERNGLNTIQAQNIRNSGNRTYNFYEYEDQTDNYQQDHYQFFYNVELSQNWNLNTALHYTKGRGYFEELRIEDDLTTYNIDPLTVDGNLVNNSDVIRRLWLDNDFYGGVFSTNYQNNRLDFTLGGAWNKYKGQHFGEVIWARFANNSNIRDRFYDNDATKTDLNLYTKVYYELFENFTAFVDLQYRQVAYDFVGFDRNGNNVTQSESLSFFNPKVGFTYNLTSASSIYAFFGIGNREPNRNDYTESSPDSRPKHETLYNFELGYRQNFKNLAYTLNAYLMSYDNQLILTGAVNDVGEFTRTNVQSSYRAGVELETKVNFTQNLNLSLNATASINKIQDFVEFTDFFGTSEDLAVLQGQGYAQDPNTGQVFRNLGETDIAFSPNFIAGSQLEYSPFDNFTVALLTKYVSEQYLDNTSSEDRKLDSFVTNDIRLSYTLKPKFVKVIDFNLLINNIFSEAYEPNGYTFGYFTSAERTTENFFYPQAGVNFLLGVGIRF